MKKSWFMKLKRQMASVLLLLMSVYCGISGGYIWSKAVVAQVMLRQAWQETSATQKVRPWPWADTYPVARLLVPQRDVDLVVLAGTTGRSLAFGPGHRADSALPGEAGQSVIAAHRDTHFSFLQHLEIAEEVLVESAERELLHYRVEALEIVDRDDLAALSQWGQFAQESLTLVTCYPFDAPIQGAPQRYLVHLTRSEQVDMPLDRKNL